MSSTPPPVRLFHPALSHNSIRFRRHGAPTAWHTLGTILLGRFRVLFCAFHTQNIPYDLTPRQSQRTRRHRDCSAFFILTIQQEEGANPAVWCRTAFWPTTGRSTWPRDSMDDRSVKKLTIIYVEIYRCSYNLSMDRRLFHRPPNISGLNSSANVCMILNLWYRELVF